MVYHDHTMSRLSFELGCCVECCKVRTLIQRNDSGEATRIG